MMNDAIRTPEGAILSLARDWYVAEGFPSLALQMEVDALDWREHILFELELNKLGHYDQGITGFGQNADGTRYEIRGGVYYELPPEKMERVQRKDAEPVFVKPWDPPDWVFPFVMGAAAMGAIALLAGWGNA